jgi:hypothetical protein
MTAKIDRPVISTGELCKLLGLTQGRLSQLTTAGLLIKEGRGRFSLAASVRSYLAFLRSGSSSGSAPKTVEDYRIGRARLVSLQGDLAQLQLDKERQEVVSIAAVAEGVGDCFAFARAKWLAVPTKYAARISPDDPAKAFKALSAAAREVLTEISEEAEAELVEMAKRKGTK